MFKIKNREMKEEQKLMMNYEAPQVEVIEVEVEKGFATSTEPIGNGITYPFS